MQKLEIIYQSLMSGEKCYRYSQLRDELKSVGIEMVTILNLKRKCDREKLLQTAQTYLYNEQPSVDFQPLQDDLTRLVAWKAMTLGFVWSEHEPSAIRYRYLLIHEETGCAGFDDIQSVIGYLDGCESRSDYEELSGEFD